LISLSFKSFSKLNLSLYVGPPTTEGLHHLKSLFQHISLSEDIHITESRNTSDSVVFVHQKVPSVNTCTKMMSLLRPYLKKYWDVQIHKCIPQGAGLGAGSANAAALCQAILKLEGIHMPLHKQMALGQQVGYDVPFFMCGCSTVVVSGFGEQVDVQTGLKKYVVLIFPGIECSTPLVYQSLDKLSEFDYLDHVDDQDLYTFGTNRLFSAAAVVYPELINIKEQLEGVINQPVFFSGSGSTFYVLADTLDDQFKLYESFKAQTSFDVCKAEFSQDGNVCNVGTEGRT
jgi:4-diphosphocytidyl-2-C-methyl-D-erythritol kinase